MLRKRVTTLAAVMLTLCTALLWSSTVGAAPLATPAACASLTPTAMQAVIDKIDASLARADADARDHGISGAYASAARDNLASLQQARSAMATLQTWLHDHGLDSPYVTNASAAFNVHGYVRETIGALQYARHWAIVSASHHHSEDARASFERTTEALDLIEPLGAAGGRCYMNQYFGE